MKYYELPGAGFEEFGFCDPGGGYDWSIFGVWLKDRVFYWASDSGCSCNGEWGSSDFPDHFKGHGSAHDAIKALHSWVSAEYIHGSSDALLSKLLDYRP